MDADRFDSLTRTLPLAGSRRRALAALTGGLGLVLGVSLRDGAAARKKCPPCKKRKNGKCKKKRPDGASCAGGTCQNGSCVRNCVKDGSKNGSETDVDCGGGCARCANGRNCTSRNDCVSALCAGGLCQACSESLECDADCFCSTAANPSMTPMCLSRTENENVEDCDNCPADTIVCIDNITHFTCVKRCGTP